MGRAIGAILFGIAFLWIYTALHDVEIGLCHVDSETFSKDVTLPFSHPSRGRQTYTFSCPLSSASEQNARIGIAVDDELLALKINNLSISLQESKRRYAQPHLNDWQSGYTFDIPLMKGENLLTVIESDSGGKFGLKIGRGLSCLDYFMIFAFGLLPILFGVYVLLFPFLIRLLSDSGIRRIFWPSLPYAILIAGIILRLFYFLNVPNTIHQHDMQGHIDAIHYYAHHPLQLPQADKSLQFPQQPLYYYAAAGVYSVSKALGGSEHDAISAVRAMSVVFSIFWLYIGFKLVKLVTRDRILINLYTAFLAFTPLFVIMSAFVNNDSLNMLLGITAAYGITAYYLTKKRHYFALAFLTVLLAMLTKISSMLYALFFAVVLLLMYLQEQEAPNRYRRQLLLLGISVLFLFGLTLVKVYLPTTGEFRFVNSALYGNQLIPYLDLGYFFTFHWFDLIEHAQATVLYNDAIRFSLPTYLYGTMFLDDHIYKELYLEGGIFKSAAQLTYLLGSIYLAGWIAYLFFFRRIPLFYRLLSLPVAINLLLVIKFLNDYWVVCNSHFRYFSPTFGVIGLLFVIGLEQLFGHWKASKQIVAYAAIPFFAAQIYWLVALVGFSG